MKAARFGLGLAVLLVLAACEKTNWETHIFHTEDLSKASVITDAKQRLVFNRTVDGRRMLCAEPSPDVAQAFSEAMKVAASLSAARETPDGGKQNLQAAGSFARSYAGAVTQLGERLAVIQLLRDEMYRACEAYANGALTQVSYTLKLARLDKKMATLLSSEMAAGAFGRPLATIGSSANVNGVDEETLRTAETAAKSEIEALKILGAKAPEAGKEEEKSQQLDAQADKANAAIANLAALQQANARLAANAMAQNGGSLQASVNENAEQSLVAIHQNFLDDTGVEPLIDACVTAMDRASFSILAKADQVSREMAQYENTSNFLQELLDSDGLTRSEQKAVKGLIAPDQAQFDAQGRPSDSTVKAMRRTINEAGFRLKSLDKLGKGGAFAVTCMNTFMTNQLNSKGFIARMIEAKKQLRSLSAEEAKARADSLRAELAVKKHDTCVAAANLLEDTAAKQQALAKCAE